MKCSYAGFSIALLAASSFAQAPPLRVVELRGTPYERGFQHGEALRAEIAELVRTWERDLVRDTGLAAPVFVERFLRATSFEVAAREHTPELLDEVRGIAAGAGFSYEQMLAYQLVDEQWAMHQLVSREKCSTIGVDRDGAAPALVAQNVDLPEWMRAHPTVLRIRHPDRELQCLVVTMPGLLGINGMNSRRIAVGVNTLLQLRPSPAGLPVAFVVRGLLMQESHAAALAFLQRVPHAAGQAYTVGGPDTAPCFEASAGGVVPWQQADRAGWRWHTNHPLASRDWALAYLERMAKEKRAPEALPRCSRFDALDRALSAEARPAVELVESALRLGGADRVCNASTYVSTTFVLGEEPELRIAPGSPATTSYCVLSFGAEARAAGASNASTGRGR